MARLDDEQQWAQRRRRMVDEQVEARGIVSRDVLTAMGTVPRERFVAPDMVMFAYDDRALGISGGQTISQPYIVARMLEALQLPRWRADHPADSTRVLEIGTGSGYQAALLASMGARVTSVERDPDLAAEAAGRLAAMGHDVDVVVADGSAGYPTSAPYAGIVVAAASPDVPAPLPDQLAMGGRLVVPVGSRDHQWLTVIERTAGGFWRYEVEPCVFVPLVGRFGFAEA